MTMQKIEASSPEAQSADILAGNLAQLKALFPELITESASGPAINVDVLKALIGDQTVADADEKYGLNSRVRQFELEKGHFREVVHVAMRVSSRFFKKSCSGTLVI